jgi:UDP-N-acetylglucosamine 2-epimerase
MANRNKINQKMNPNFTKRLADAMYTNNKKAKRNLNKEKLQRKLTNEDIYNVGKVYFRAFD